MKKKWLVALLILALIVGGYFIFKKSMDRKSVVVSADSLKEEETVYQTMNRDFDEEIPLYTDIPLNKVWEYDFSIPIDKSTVNPSSIKVLDQYNREIPISLMLDDEGNKLRIEPPKGNYQKDNTYHFEATNTIKHTDGTPVTNIPKFDFMTIRDEVEKGTLKKGILFIKQEQIKSVNGTTIKLSKNVKDNLKKWDILILPSNEEPSGQAVKVVSVEKNLTSYIVVVEKPHFAELYEELDIYKNYKIEPKNITLSKDLKGLSLVSSSETNLNTLNPSDITASPLKNNEPANIQKVGDFNPPKIRLDLTDGLKFMFKNVIITDGKLKVGLNGTITLAQPEINTDVQLSFMKIKKFKMVAKEHAQSELNVAFNSFKDEKTKKVNFSNKVKMADIRIPTEVPGLSILAGIFLQVRYEYALKPEVTFTIEAYDERGFIYYNGKTRNIKDSSSDFDIGMKGEGEAKGNIGPAIDFGLSAFKIVEGGEETFAGVSAEGGVYAGVNKENGLYACWKAAVDGVAEGRIFLDVLEKRILEVKLLKKIFPPHINEGDCSVFQDLSISHDPLSMKSGNTAELSLKGNYVDLSNNKHDEKELEKKENIKVISSNEKVATASFKDGKLIVQASSNPTGPNATITVQYAEDSNIFEKELTAKVDLPVKITDYMEIKLDGEWTRNLLNDIGSLTISHANPSSFDFDLGVQDGAHAGQIGGKATINGKKAIFVDPEQGCRLDFSLGKDKISIKQSDECIYWQGVGATFDGTYDKGGPNVHEDLVSLGILTNQSDDKLFRSVVGSNYDLFVNNMTTYSSETDIDSLNTRVVQGFVSGMAPDMAGIIMINKTYVYAAVLVEGVVKIYSNDPNYREIKMPNTIAEWMKGLAYSTFSLE